MSPVADVLMNSDDPIALVAEDELPIDLLDRQKIIDRIMQLLSIISDNRSSCTFALSGAWGIGKTFILNRLTKMLLDYQDGEKYLVFHYNCWQYDYYEEPLIAIVAAMLDSIDQENHIFSKSLREKARQGMTFAKPIVERIAKDFVKQKIGIDITDLISLVKDGNDALDELNEAPLRDFDKYYSFKKAIDAAQRSIRELAETKTVVIVVDELDRCLPSYAIKVLERLHHLFSNLENSVVLLAVDKNQLDKTVSQIFGEGTDTTKYLRKFINFELQLGPGRITDGFFDKYSYYIDLFDEELIETSFSFESFFTAIFSGIDARSQERIIDRLFTVHKLLFPDMKKDYAFMCAEVMWVVLSEYHGLNTSMPISYDASYEKQCFTMKPGSFPEFRKYLEEEWGVIGTRNIHYLGTELQRREFTSIDIPQLLFGYLGQMYSTPDQLQIAISRPWPEEYEQNIEDLKKYVELLQIIK